VGGHGGRMRTTALARFTTVHRIISEHRFARPWSSISRNAHANASVRVSSERLQEDGEVMIASSVRSGTVSQQCT
jgi:hypothetical protein